MSRPHRAGFSAEAMESVCGRITSQIQHFNGSAFHRDYVLDMIELFPRTRRSLQEIATGGREPIANSLGQSGQVAAGRYRRQDSFLQYFAASGPCAQRDASFLLWRAQRPGL